MENLNFITRVKIIFRITMALLVAGKISLAQYTFTPSTTFIQNMNFNDLNYDGITITNNSSSTLYLDWTLISVDTVQGCHFDMCASGTCYLGIPSTGSFTDPFTFQPGILAGKTGWLKRHFFTDSIPGTHKAVFYVYEPSNPGGGDTLTFITNIGISSIEEKNGWNSLVNIFPNPSADYINIIVRDHQQEYYASILNTLGEVVLEKTVFTGESNQVSLKNLKTGTYFLHLRDGRGNVFVNRIIKTN